MGVGKVFLVGAGPGDPELLTLKAMRVLKSADVLLYDFLVHPNFLNYLPSHAVKICVGKRKGYHLKTQEEINDLMVQYGCDGKTVVRLKGGDPCVFGRVGEEMACLEANHIPYEIVPGISSAIAGPAYAGIPMTHRTMSRSFAIVTGSLAKGSPVSSLSIPKADTLVFLMGVHSASEIARFLVEEGYFLPDTPVAFVYKATLAAQKETHGTLSDVSRLVGGGVVQSPSIFIVGDVTLLPSEGSWRRYLPLAGQRVMVLRSMLQNDIWTTRFSELGAEVAQCPLLDFKAVSNPGVSLDVLDRCDLLMFTSQNGVSYFMDCLLGQGRDVRSLSRLKILSIGSSTSSKLRDFGLSPDYELKQSSTEGLLNEPVLRGKSIVWPTTKIASHALQEGLSQLGELTRINVYDTVALDVSSFFVCDGDWVIFSSASTVRFFFEANWQFVGKFTPVCIGSTTASVYREVFGHDPLVADSPGIDGLLGVIYDRLGR